MTMDLIYNMTMDLMWTFRDLCGPFFKLCLNSCPELGSNKSRVLNSKGYHWTYLYRVNRLDCMAGLYGRIHLRLKMNVKILIPDFLF